MAELIKPQAPGKVATFEPQAAKVRDAQGDAVIAYARRVKDWPLLEQAVDQKLDDQEEFTRWWGETVTPGHRPGRGGVELSADLGVIPMVEAETRTGITHQVVSLWRKRLRDRPRYRELLYGVAYRKAMQETANTIATKWTGNPESYTPAQYIESARTVLGTIDLDPASDKLAQKIVQAGKWFSIKDDGLKQEWGGRVWLNPPYHSAITQFVDKLCDEILAANVTDAILLTNNNTDTKWWHLAASVHSAVCFTLGRISFYQADGVKTAPTNGSTFFYFGGNLRGFKDEFAQYGLVVPMP